MSEVDVAEDEAKCERLGGEAAALFLDDMSQARAYAAGMGNLTRERLLQAILESARLQGIWLRAGSAWRNRPQLARVGSLSKSFVSPELEDAREEEAAAERWAEDPDDAAHFGPETSREALRVALNKLAEMGYGEYLEDLGHFCGD